jgi:hypothetical protein
MKTRKMINNQTEANTSGKTERRLADHLKLPNEYPGGEGNR